MEGEAKNSIPYSPNHLLVGFVNVRGQAIGQSLTQSKINQLVDFIKLYSLDIVNMQETNIMESTFNNCDYINQNFEIIYNNAPTKYGTCVLISSAIQYSNVIMDQAGKVIIYDLPELNITGGNVYLQCGA